jgi:hypothetical protein
VEEVKDGSHLEQGASSVGGSNNRTILIIIGVLIGVFLILPLCGLFVGIASLYIFLQISSDTTVIGDDYDSRITENIIIEDESEIQNDYWENPEYISETYNCINGYGTEYTLDIEYPSSVSVDTVSGSTDDCLLNFRYLDGVMSVDTDYGETYPSALSEEFVVIKEGVTHVSFPSISGDLIRIEHGTKTYSYATLLDGNCDATGGYEIESPCGFSVHTLLPGLRSASIVILQSSSEEDTEEILKVFDDISVRFSGSDFERE